MQNTSKYLPVICRISRMIIMKNIESRYEFKLILSFHYTGQFEQVKK